VRFLADPLVRISEGARAELSELERDLSKSLSVRGSVEAIDRIGDRRDKCMRRHESAWAEATTVGTGLWFHRLAGWVIRLDLTVLVVLAGVSLSFAVDIIVQWKLNHSRPSEVEFVLLSGGLIAGLATASLAGAGDKIHRRVQEAWGGTGDAPNIEEMTAASLARRLLGNALVVMLGFALAASAIILL
jgi:hypothetical protein